MMNTARRCCGVCVSLAQLYETMCTVTQCVARVRLQPVRLVLFAFFKPTAVNELEFLNLSYRNKLTTKTINYL